jgi:N-acetylneuraminic acid mutarotase
VEGAGELKCVRHQKATRITCVTCDTPICPDCAIRTAVGFKCPDHASKKAATSSKPSRAGGIVLLLAIAGIILFVQVARNTGRGEPAKPPCPTETAPDVGIGSEGGTHWKELPAAGLCGRYEAASVWTGSELLIWGGENCAGAACPTFRAPHLADGGAYTPATSKWRKLASSPLSARAPAATAWTGNEMLVWGGVGEDFLADGAAYDPAANRWRPMAASPLAARARAQSAWTGSELIVWGGGAPDQTFGDGAAYNPATDRWRPIAASPLAARMGDVAAWTGRELVIWGGVDDSTTQEFRDGAAYDPETDRWRAIATAPMPGRDDPAWAWTGRELVVWGGSTLAGNLLNDGAVYDPATDRWRAMANAPIGHRSGPAAVWSGRELLVWGGFAAPGATDNGPLDRVIERRTLLNPADDGAAYDPATNRWRPLEQVPLLGRGFPVAVWDGGGMLMWGGLVVVSSPASSSEGVRYTP